MDYGLIGMPLGHSFSKPIHEKLGGYAYELCPLTEQGVETLLRERRFKGLNVTIPYKRFVLPLCDEIDPRASAIGAANTIVNRGGRLAAYNTDYDGFLYLARQLGVSFKGKTVLILGSGGTRRTVAAVAQAEGAAQILIASRRPGPGLISYEAACGEKGVQILVNATPVGMYPDCGGLPLNPAAFPRLEAVLDAVYNPLRTRLVQEALALGVPACGGLPMLAAQAKRAAELFLGTSLGETAIADISREMWQARSNLVLIGMPGSGKTAVGRACAQLLGRPFVDVDEAVAEAAGKPIAAIFQEGGEAAFRKMEARAIQAAARETGQVVATGGGAVLRPGNVARLRQNGVLLHLTRPLERLALGGGRPLSQSRADLEALWARRAPLYAAAAQATVENAGSVAETARRACAAFLAAAQPPYLKTPTERNTQA